MILRAVLDLVSGSAASKYPRAKGRSGLRSDKILGITLLVKFAWEKAFQLGLEIEMKPRYTVTKKITALPIRSIFLTWTS